MKRYLKAEAAPASTMVQMPSIASQAGACPQSQRTGSYKQVVLAALKAVPCKGYILTAPDLVPMAMMRSSESKARALGWLGKPCSTVCGEKGGHLHKHSCPWPIQRLTPRQPLGFAAAVHQDSSWVPMLCVCSLTEKWAIMPPVGMEGSEPSPRPLALVSIPLYSGL